VDGVFGRYLVDQISSAVASLSIKLKPSEKKTVEHIESMPGKLQRNLKYVS
jgi:hypothetical protein